MCGRSVGIAVRCNMVADQNDFAILRYNVLGGLRARNPNMTEFSEVENAFDLSALEMMHKVGACQGADAEMTTLAQEIQKTVAKCTEPKS